MMMMPFASLFVFVFFSLLSLHINAHMNKKEINNCRERNCNSKIMIK